MYFRQDFIEKLRNANDIVQVISQYTELKGRGDRHVGLCPYPDHNEKTPSFSVSSSKQFFYCFGCKKSGDVFTFVQDFMGFDFPQAVEHLAHRSGIKITDDDMERNYKRPKNFEERSEMWEVNELACDHFKKNLKARKGKDPFLNYCEKRGFLKKTMETFELGVAEIHWDGLVQFLREKKADIKVAEKLGLIRPKKSKGYYDLFRSRLMFPIRSQNGHVVGFGGRTLLDEVPKYVNSPESLIFLKGKTLYGLNETGKHIRSQDQAIVVEGYTDLLSLYSVGIKNVVATLGTALTKDHAQILKKLTSNVLLLFDGDEAGRKAMERVLVLLYAEGLLPRTFLLPKDLDPDDFVKKEGKKGVQKKIKEESMELFGFFINEWFKDYEDTPSGKLLMLEKCAPILGVIPDSRLKDLYVQELARRFRVKAEWIHKTLPKNKKKTPPAPPIKRPEEEGVIHIDTKKCFKSEIFLLNLALKYESVFLKLRESPVIDRLSHPGIQAIFRKMSHFYTQNPENFEKITSKLINFVQPAHVLVEYAEEEHIGALETGGQEKLDLFVEECVLKIHNNHLKRQQERISKEGPMDEESVKKIMELQKEKRIR